MKTACCLLLTLLPAINWAAAEQSPNTVTDHGDFLEISRYRSEADSQALWSSLVRKSAISSVTMIQRARHPLVRIVTQKKIGQLSGEKDSIYFMVHDSIEEAEKTYGAIKGILQADHSD